MKSLQTYGFDTVGRTIQNQHSDYLNVGTALTRTYTYSPKDELKSVNLNGAQKYVYNYDLNSNLTRFETLRNKALPQDNMSIDPNFDRITQKQMKDGRKITFQYDAEGNVTQKTRWMANGQEDEKSLAFSYNYQGQVHA